MTLRRRPGRSAIESPSKPIDKEISRIGAVVERGRQLLEQAVRKRLAAQSELAELRAELCRLEAETSLLGDATPARLSPAKMRRRAGQLERLAEQSRERERQLSMAVGQGEAALTNLKREADEIQRLWSEAHRLTRMRVMASGLIAETSREAWGGLPRHALADMGEGEATLYAAVDARLREWSRRVATTIGTLSSQLRGR